MRRPMKRMLKLVVLLFAVVAMFAPGEVMGTLITLSPSKDNTLYETVDGSRSNGAGSYLFAGLTKGDGGDPPKVRRAVIAFDIAGNVPAGSIIQSATLTLEMSRTVVGAMTFDLHRLTSDWGEGT